MKIEKIDNENYIVDGVGVWFTDGVARCVECSGPLVAMSKSCRHARAVMRLTKRAADERESARSKRIKNKATIYLTKEIASVGRVPRKFWHRH